MAGEPPKAPSPSPDAKGERTLIERLAGYAAGIRRGALFPETITDYAPQDEALATALIAFAKLPSPAPSPPDAKGEREWKLVPVEPTEEMIEAHAQLDSPNVLDTWSAMLAAAPSPDDKEYGGLALSLRARAGALRGRYCAEDVKLDLDAADAITTLKRELVEARAERDLYRKDAAAALGGLERADTRIAALEK